MSLDLVATCSFGLEAVLIRELAALGYEASSPQTGRVEFRGDERAIARANMFLRSADRVLVLVGRFPVHNFDHLFEGVRALPWQDWIGPEDAFPVAGRSVKSVLTSVPAVQRATKKAIVEGLMAAHGRRHLPENGAERAVEVALLKNVASVTLDTSGAGLHKRGWRDLTGAAPLRETMASALVQLSFWREGRALADPYCGSGTIVVEAAMLGRRMAPGYGRSFAAERWARLGSDVWQEARQEARDIVGPPLDERLQASDIDPAAVSMARRHAERAGVAGDIHFQCRPFAELSSQRRYGSVVTNPPYGERLERRPDVEALYRTMPEVFARLDTWSFFVLTSWRDFERVVGRRADRRRKLYNAGIECTYYQFHGPRPPRRDEDAVEPAAGRPG